ncbi:MAG: (deoxy)nucleoside triphosphate pyrophosphohydrolase [Bacteroidales bacterium]|nr:(deoxy)nucleoside triphosphate pyrophosphohydrolase [Bacteroidales bacterium]
MINVTCAIIQEGNKILAVKRAHGMHLAGKWEFPGGKIEPGESAEDCIVREILEELQIRITVIKLLNPVEHHYLEKSIRLIPFACRILSGKIKLAEHEEFVWIKKTEILLLNWAEADMKLIEENAMI